MDEMPNWCQVTGALTLRSTEGNEVPISAVQIHWERAAHTVLDVRLVFEVDGLTWQQIDAEHLFHLHPDARRPSFLDAFDPGRPVEIEARLEGSLLARFSAAEDIFDAAGALVGAAPGDPLRATESYYALYVKQQVHPQVKAGFTTRWSKESEE